MNHSTPGLPVHYQLPEFTETHVHQVSDAIQPSHPLSSPSPPASNPSQHQSLFQWVNSSYEVAKVLEFERWHHSFQRHPRADLLQNDGINLSSWWQPWYYFNPILLGGNWGMRNFQYSENTALLWSHYFRRGRCLRLHLENGCFFLSCKGTTMNATWMNWSLHSENKELPEGDWQECTHWKRPWCWERLRAEEKGATDDGMIGSDYQAPYAQFIRG